MRFYLSIYCKNSINEHLIHSFMKKDIIPDTVNKPFPSLVTVLFKYEHAWWLVGDDMVSTLYFLFKPSRRHYRHVLQPAQIDNIEPTSTTAY